MESVLTIDFQCPLVSLSLFTLYCLRIFRAIRMSYLDADLTGLLSQYMYSSLIGSDTRVARPADDMKRKKILARIVPDFWANAV